MKPLYWTRIVAPIIPQDCVDGEKVSEIEKENGDDVEELWKEIDETNLDNLDEFTELFSRQGVVPKAKTTISLPKVKTIKVLDSKRSQNVGIFVRSIHVDFSEIEHAIYHCDTSVVNLETLQHIMEIRATNDELSLIKEAIEAAQQDEASQPSPSLDAPENFLFKISQISSSAERISCIVFQAEFDEQCTMVSRKLSTLKSICELLIEKDGLKEVFSIILTLGNFMNGGNRQRGQADGFGLEILGKLKDVKSKDPKITLLHFIVKTYIERCRKNGVAISELVAPVPNPNDVEKMLSLDFEELKKQLESLQKKIEECRKTTEKVVKASPEDGVQPFKQKMEEFHEMAIKKIDSRFTKLDECKGIFIKTLKFYKFIPKKMTLEETPPQQFFEYWTTFCSDFDDIFKKECQILTNKL
jgi:formin 2